jgi:hypothetical protein
MEMQKDDVITLAHFLSAMKEASARLEEAIRKKDSEKILGAKREIIDIQAKIKRMV